MEYARRGYRGGNHGQFELDAIRQEIREEFQSELARRDRQIEALREELKRRVDVYSVSHELEMVRTQIRFEIVQHEGNR